MIKKIVKSGDIFKKYMDQIGIIQDDLVEEFRVSHSYISRIMNSIIFPTPKYFEKFKKKFDFTIEDEYNLVLYKKFIKIDPIWQQLIYTMIDYSNSNPNKFLESKEYIEFLEFKNMNNILKENGLSFLIKS